MRECAAGRPSVDAVVLRAFLLTLSLPSWRLAAAQVYQEQDNFDDNGFAWFKSFREAPPGSPLFDRGMFRNADVLAALASDVVAGALPQVSIVISRQNVSEHAPFSPTLGERYMHDLLQIFKASPAVYAKTAVLLMYDEGALVLRTPKVLVCFR